MNGFAARVGRSAFKSAARHPGLHSSGAAPLYYDRLQIVFKIARLPCCCISRSNLQHSSRSICMCIVRENTGDCPLMRTLVFVCYDSAWLSIETCSISQLNDSEWAQYKLTVTTGKPHFTIRQKVHLKQDSRYRARRRETVLNGFNRKKED